MTQSLTSFLPATPHVPHEPPPAENSMPDMGILSALMQDGSVNDILVNGLNPIYVDVRGQLQDTGLRFRTHEEIWEVAERIMAAVNQRWHPERPLIDTRLPDGSRVNIVAPPMAVDGVTISIRKFPAQHITLDTMGGNLPKEYVEFLKICAQRKLNIIVAGGTSSGKTTLMNALCGAIAPKERIVTIEDSAELRLPLPHVVRLESKQPLALNAPETAVTIRDLVKNALRMRPDRIIVGESRGPEAVDVLQAMNTGHDGSMTTLHANTPREALNRLETMVSIAMPQLPPRVVRQQIASTIHLLVQMARTKDGTRRITHATEVAGMEGEVIVMQDLFVYQENKDGGGEYRWLATSPRNSHVNEAARQAGLVRTLR
jgi:pilus assembly protein CpaF